MDHNKSFLHIFPSIPLCFGKAALSPVFPRRVERDGRSSPVQRTSPESKPRRLLADLRAPGPAAGGALKAASLRRAPLLTSGGATTAL
ncbi:hypothetical protein EYF80_058471 [Liparis tanakae]|uniref:Uncharacterized protein n=1 Tax=Liparis tanakae TaxID=230148 RepID=A0A4Z2ESN5_9TELE|nr:hypothetical protein EYF80_058471 [Liparis tanakae]